MTQRRNFLRTLLGACAALGACSRASFLEDFTEPSLHSFPTYIDTLHTPRTHIFITPEQWRYVTVGSTMNGTRPIYHEGDLIAVAQIQSQAKWVKIRREGKTPEKLYPILGVPYGWENEQFALYPIR